MSKESHKPHIVLFDLETIPDLKEALKVWPQLGNYPGLTLKASINTIICFGWKVLGEGKAQCCSTWNFPRRWARDVNDDYAVVKFAYETLKDADAVITQNGKRFDWKFLQTRLMHHGFPPLPRLQHIDTKVVAKQNLFIFNNSLKQLARFLTDTEKQENEGWDLWVRVWGRDPEAQQEMARYCIQDVRALEEVFLSLRPFVRELPNYNMFRRDAIECCSNCGGLNFMRNGNRITKEGRVQRLQCRDCGTSMTDSTARKPPRTY